MIRLGYVGINTLLPTASKTFRLANYTEERMLSTARKNLSALEKILQWNDEHNIKLFRITSALIPFGSHPINSGKWKDALQEKLLNIGRFIRNHNMRVSMHPGQYTVVNSPTEDYYQRALEDLNYHCAVLDLMELDSTHIFIIHGGGIYHDKDNSTDVLIKRLLDLPPNQSQRLVIENDERNYNAENIYFICKKTNLPGIIDVFHHQCFPGFDNLNIRGVILKIKETWPEFKRQKIHYSNQAPGKHTGAHSENVDLEKFLKFYQDVKDLELDIMIETKNKQASLLSLRNAISELL